MIGIRGREVSRIESFSDAVFGFALTLLVASLEVPRDFVELKATLLGFLPFAVTFALVCYLWYSHYKFFRRYGPDDGLTIFLNCILLFVVLFFVYPLKFVFGNLIPRVTGIGNTNQTGFNGMSYLDTQFLMVAYSSGVVAVFTVFTLLYWNALRQRERLKLDSSDIYDAHTQIYAHSMSTGLGVASIALALAAPGAIYLSGMIYFLEGPCQGLNGYLRGRRRDRVLPSSTPALP